MRNKGLCIELIEPSSNIFHRYRLNRGSVLSSQDYNPSLVVYVPEPIGAI